MPSHVLNDTEMTSQSIFLHSTDAVISISSAEKVFYLDQSISAPPGYRILVGLTNLTVPNTMYNVTATTNTITLASVPDDTNYIIPNGNYTGETLKDAINTALGSVGTCAFSDENNVFSFTFASAETVVSSTMERQLGLTGQLPMPSPATTLAANSVCDLGGVTNIYIRIRNLTMNNLDSRGKTSNIIASIVNNTNYGGYIFYVPPEVLYYQVVESTINHLDFELTDQEGDVLDLNGASFNITLTCHFVKQRDAHVPRVLKPPEEAKTETGEKKNDS
jgi:hypothetical protein